MGTTAAEIPHLRIGAERGYGVIDLDSIAVTPDNWHDWSSPFTPPPENLSIEFPNVDVLDKNSCSACVSTLFLLLKHYRDRLFEYFPSDTSLCIAIGKGHEEVPEGTLCIGNCTALHRDIGIFIPGCPPVSRPRTGRIQRIVGLVSNTLQFGRDFHSRKGGPTMAGSLTLEPISKIRLRPHGGAADRLKMCRACCRFSPPRVC
jgi:hypothetical protein